MKAPMTKLEQAYEQAKVKQRAAQRALFIADGQNLPAKDILRLKRALDAALFERRQAFTAWMDEVDAAVEPNRPR